MSEATRQDSSVHSDERTSANASTPTRFVRTTARLPRGVFALPKSPDPSLKVSSSASAWTQGVIDTCFAVMTGVAGQSDGKVYHKFKIDSPEELEWHKACNWTAERLMKGAILQNEMRQPSNR